MHASTHARSRSAAALLAACLSLSTHVAQADQPPPSGVVSLQSSASADVPQDWMTVTLTTTREGADAGAVQTELKKALDAALAEARRAAQPGQIEVRTGNFSLGPRYVKTVVSGWQGGTELIVEGRDMAGIGQLVGRIATLTVARVGYGLSREQREKVEAEIATRAIVNYQAKAADYAKRFGYSGYTVREVNVSAADTPPVQRPMQMMARSSGVSSFDEALPVEAGKATVSVTVNGSIQLLK